MSASNYWKQRNAREKTLKALRQDTEKRLHEAAIERNAVASVLPGKSIPSELDRFPVIIHNANGVRVVCKHLV